MGRKKEETAETLAGQPRHMHQGEEPTQDVYAWVVLLVVCVCVNKQGRGKEKEKQEMGSEREAM